MKKAILARIEAKEGKEADVEALLEKGLQLANEEYTTPVWYALKFGPRSFGVFDSFYSEQDRSLHLEGLIAKALMDSAPSLLEGAPVIENVDVLGVKIAS